MKPRNHSLRAFTLGLILAGTSAPVHAGVSPWEFEVYPVRTLNQGVGELGLVNAYIPSGHTVGDEGVSAGDAPSHHTWYSATEFAYGLTDRLEAAVEFQFARVPGLGWQGAGQSLRLRGQFPTDPISPTKLGWWLELERHRSPLFDGAAHELGLRLLYERDFGPFTLLLDPAFEKVLSGPERHLGLEFAYSAAVQFRHTRRLSYGLEFYGATGLINDRDPLADQQHYLVPTLWGKLPGGREYNVGLGWGLTSNSDRVLIKFTLEFEHYLGPAKGGF